MTLPLYEQFLRLLLALVLGSLIGFERERRDRGAGLRTHALVSLGAALVVIVSAYGFNGVVRDGLVVLDPSRVAAQVVSGIGFLGAGTIIVQRATVRGLTTAASIWLVGGIGLACGAGLYVLAVFGAILALLVLVPFKTAEQRLFHHQQPGLELRLRRGDGQMAPIDSVIRAAGIDVRSMRLVADPAGTADRLLIELQPAAADRLNALVDELRRLDGVERISLRPQRRA